jgi:hypothetical protein
MHFQWNARPFMWLRKAFPERPSAPMPAPSRPTLGPAWRSGSTRELTDADEDAAVALLVNAVTGCRLPFEDARAAWVRWRTEGTLVGTFDTDGGLVALRVYDQIDGDTIRQRATSFGAGALTASGRVSPAVVRSVIAYARALGVTTIFAPIVGGDLEELRGRAAAVGGQVRVGVGAQDHAAVFDVDELDRRTR